MGSTLFPWTMIKGDVESLNADRLGQERLWILDGFFFVSVTAVMN